MEKENKGREEKGKGKGQGRMRLELTASSCWEKRGTSGASDSSGRSGDEFGSAMCDTDRL